VNTREYIESGILDLYAAGLLSLEEMRDVEFKACQNAELKEELTSVQLAFEGYALKHALVPPPGLKKEVMKRIGLLKGVPDAPRVIAMSEKRSNRALPWLAAAGIALLLALGGLTLRYSSQVNSLTQQVAGLETRQQELQTDLDGSKNLALQRLQQVAWLTDSQTVRVEMKGTPLSPGSLAVVYWNKNSQEVFLDIENLPPTAADKQYQLWFIDAEKGPVSAGVFEATPNELLRMVNAPAAAAFAVTLEPRGGSAAPTLDQMYVVGNVPS
jgi:anti-sigma-K factor RskA